jgi:DNA-binding NtrC family response regulator
MTVKQNTAGDDRRRLTLLVVDDETAVCRAVARVMKRHFDTVVTADSPQEARAVLGTRPVTHLICDHWFGKGQPSGLELITQWLKVHPSLERVLLLTGVDTSMLIAPDPKVKIIRKAVDVKDLLKELEIEP